MARTTFPRAHLAIITALLDLEPTASEPHTITYPAVTFRATQQNANAARTQGNIYLRAIGRHHHRLTISRMTTPPHGAGRASMWAARLTRKTTP